MQLQIGNLDVTATTGQDHAPLPGVTVNLYQGTNPPGVQVTDAQGRADFQGLMPGACTVRGELTGFSPATGEATIQPGRTARVELVLQAAVHERIDG